MSKYILPCLLSFLFCISSLVSAGIVHVPQDQPSIQAGINAATNGDTVLVADSTYYENINFMGKAITVASYMIMDNDTTHRESTIINGSQPINPDSGSVVFFVSGEDTTSVIYGFTITGGTGTLYDTERKIGGGICLFSSGACINFNKIILNTISYNQKCLGGGIGSWPESNLHQVIIQNNIIESNSINANDIAKGGGIFLIGGKIKDNIIRQNTSQADLRWSQGGGIAATCDTLVYRPLLIISGNTIANNQVITNSTNSDYGALGGGLDTQWNNIQLTDNLVSDNIVSGVALGVGGGVRIYGAGNISSVKDNIFSSNSFSDGDCIGGGLCLYKTKRINIQDNHFINNIASSLGGGIYDEGTSGTVISGNEFIGNSTDPNFSAGGGVQCYLSNEITITGNLFKQNSAYQCGGVGSQDSDLLLTNNLFTKNQAYEAGAIGVSQFWPTLRIVQIINNTVTGNEADIAGGIELEEALELKVLNNICWGNSATFAPEIYVKGGTMDIGYSNIRFGADSIQVGSGATLNWLAGNIDTDPLFESGDTLYHLSSASPCINVGIDSLLMGGTMVNCPPDDYEGDIRPFPGTPPDIGADETDIPVGIEPQLVAEIPKSYALSQNYPNPFNSTTNIQFSIPKSEFVTLKVYNILGEEVATLVLEKLSAGRYKYEWDASGLASGVYFYKLETSDFTQTRKMLLMR